MSTLEDRAKDICAEVWGFRPDRQIKPVHLANGLFRAICGQAGNPARIQKVAGGFRAGDSPMSTDEILREYADLFHTQSRTNPKDQVNDLRSALDLVLTQDRSMFANGPFAMTLTHRLHTTSDPSDRGTGEFLARLLASDAGGDAISVLRRCLENPNDNTFILTAPLLTSRTIGAPPVSDEGTIRRVDESPVLRSIQRAFQVLVEQEPLLEKTEFLQRIVTLGSFSLYLYLINRDSSNGSRMPVLLCAANPSDQVREASRSTFNRSRQKIQQAFARELRADLTRGARDVLNETQYRELFRSWLPDLGQDTKEGRKQGKIWESFVQDFESHLLGAGDTVDAFVNAVVPAMFMALTEEPTEVGTTIGRLCGLVYPRVQGRGDKYYAPSPSFLDMLVTALVEPDEEITADQFWDRAWDQFGLSCGAKGSLDVKRLTQYGIRQASPVQLEENAREMILQLTAMGHARQLPDDVAMIRGIGRQRG